MFLNDYHPHARQREFHVGAKRFAALSAGARGGKTIAAAHEVFKRIMLDRRRKSGRLHYWFAAPTLSIGKVQSEAFWRIIGGVKSPLVDHYLAAERELRLHDDILIEFKTAERPDNLVAVGLDGLWLDEAARIKQDAWLGNLRMRLTALARVRTVTVAAPHRGLAFFPAERLIWDGDGLRATYHVYRVTRDYARGVGEVRAVAADDGNTYFGGALTDADDPAFAGSTEQQRRDHAFVTPGDGILDPEQPTVHYAIIT